MNKRDLKADLELCNKATPGPWEFGPIYAGTIAGELDEERHRANRELLNNFREGWPHAIERAIKAEAEVEQLKGEIEQLLEIAFAHIPDVMRRHGYYVDANPEEDSEE